MKLKFLKYALVAASMTLALVGCGGVETTDKWTYGDTDVYEYISKVNQDIQSNHRKQIMDKIEYSADKMYSEGYNIVLAMHAKSAKSTDFNQDNFKKFLFEKEICKNDLLVMSDDYLKYKIGFADNKTLEVKINKKADCKITF